MPHPNQRLYLTTSASTPTSPLRLSSSSTAPITSSQLCEGLGDKKQRYPGNAGITRAVNALSKKLNHGETTDQYLVFQPFTVNELEKVDKRRDEVGKGIRLTHCADIGTLIIKVPTTGHEVVAEGFKAELLERFIQMGLPRRERTGLGATRFTGTSTTSKEADGAFKPGTLRPYEMDWPTLVLEVGVSESLPKLRNDARWWLSNSGGSVNIVLIFHINQGAKSILIERWETTSALTSRPITRSTARSNGNQPPAQIPTEMQAITVDPNGVITGAPLTLDFHQIFLRQANPPEHNMVFTAQDLRDWSDSIWAVLI